MRRLLVGLVVCASCGSDDLIDGQFTAPEWDFIQSFRLDRQTPAACPGGLASCDPQARLGQAMFFDPRFSGPILVAADGDNGGLGAIGERGKVACSACHDPARWFVDDRSRPNASSLGTAWTRRNTPTLVDAVYQKSFAWNGKYASLGDVLELATNSTAALDTTAREFVDVLAANYRAEYDTAFDPDLPVAISDAEVPAIFANAELAFAAYEARLVAGPTPFDRYAAGDDVPEFTAAAKRGLAVFIGRGLCSECHTGPMFSDAGFHNTGVEQRGDHAAATDHGRGDVTGAPADDGAFRTPSLRHVAETAPYMHAGQLANLAEVIDFYRRGGGPSGFVGTRDPRIVPLDLDDQDSLDLEAFLRTLTGTPVDPSLMGPP